MKLSFNRAPFGRRARFAAMALALAAALAVIPSAWATHASGSSSAFGAQASGAVVVAATPTTAYTIPGTGTSNTLALLQVPPLILTGALNVSAGPVGSAADPDGTTASSDVASVILDVTVTAVAQAIDTDCTASAAGLSSTVNVIGLSIGTNFVNFSGSVPPNSVALGLPVGVSVTVHERIVTGNSVTANGLHVNVLTPPQDIIITSVTCQASTVTSVTIGMLSAARSGKSVVLGWRAAADVLGFNVYRQVGSKARVKVNRSLIRARFGSAGSYRFVDRSPLARGSSRYWLQAVGLNGSRTWHGPVGVH